MDIEQVILNNLKRYYIDAYNKRIHIDNIYRERIDIDPKQQNSICLWNGYNGIIRVNNKCNHLLLYNCNNITIHADNFISGITTLLFLGLKINDSSCKYFSFSFIIIPLNEPLTRNTLT